MYKIDKNNVDIKSVFISKEASLQRELITNIKNSSLILKDANSQRQLVNNRKSIDF